MSRHFHSMAWAMYALVLLLATPRLVSALQVTPNSPCASLCQDSPDLDVSDPNSSSTKNSDIVCEDAAYSSAAGSKFKSCMTCLQRSTFSQGSESDTMWFLYNLRYAAAYCVFGFPNATDIPSTPCRTDPACGLLEASMKHGIPDPGSTTAFSYCSAGNGEAMDPHNFDTCVSCVSAEGRTDYLANYFVALQAGCEQQPEPGVLLGLNGTLFSNTQVSIVDPAALDGDSSSGPSIAAPAIAGVVTGLVVLVLAVSAAAFICWRRRRSRRARASAEANFFSRFNRQHDSGMSFQCQTHLVSPRFWPGAGECAPVPADETGAVQVDRSSVCKSSEGDSEAPSTQDDSDECVSKKAATASAAPLHISTSVPPVPPPQAYKSPLSADSACSTTALLPPSSSSSFRPYVPAATAAEHGVHGTTLPSAPASTFSTFSSSSSSSPSTGSGATPLLKSDGWAEETGHELQHQQKPPQKRLMGLGKKHPKTAAPGDPVESVEIQTAFAAPPKR